MKDRLPISPNGFLDTIQGEGDLLGTPMHFLRLAGCSVGCDGCDTNYSVAERLSIAEIIERLQRLPRREWVWLTGGEPTDHPLGDLAAALRGEGYRIALATSGANETAKDGWRPDVEFLSVSPHWNYGDCRWQLRSGHQLNVCHGLNGVDCRTFAGMRQPDRFASRWVTPSMYDRTGTTWEPTECLEFVKANAGWKLGIQAHKSWGVA